MESSNIHLAGVRRLLREAKELSEPTSEYSASPLEGNIFEWHFTIRGPPDTPYQGGIYHGRIIFPTDYPIKPPEIIFLTPNGRFQINHKICLSISSFHPERWRPSWSVRTILLAIIGFLPTPAEGAIGAAEVTVVEKIRLATASSVWKCSVCEKCNRELLANQDDAESASVAAEAQKIQTQVFLNSKESEPVNQEPDPVPETPSIKNQPVINQQPSSAWSGRMRIPVDGVHIRKLRPTGNHFNNDSVVELMFPFYDWDQEERNNPVFLKETLPVNNENQNDLFIPSTRVRRDQAFNPYFHIAYILTLIILFILLLTLGKRIINIIIQILNS